MKENKKNTNTNQKSKQTKEKMHISSTKKCNQMSLKKAKRKMKWKKIIIKKI